jgi:hypothetical protein
LNTRSVAQFVGFCQNKEDSAMMLAYTQRKWQLTRPGKENTKHTCHILHRKIKEENKCNPYVGNLLFN